MNEILWKIGGEAGFGIKKAGLLFSKLLSRLGFSIFNYTEYPSLVKGGLNTFEVAFSDSQKSFLKKDIDVLVCLNEKVFNVSKDYIKPDTRVIFDPLTFKPEGEFIKVACPVSKILDKSGNSAIFSNMIFLGVTLFIFDFPIEKAFSLINDVFKGKSEEVISVNKKMISEGYSWAKENLGEKNRIKLNKVSELKKRAVLTGNDAFALGAVAGNCKLYAAYPMTPASSVLSSLALWQEKVNSVVVHTEDEISAVNMAIGASFAGVRSAVGTSGGGFALMEESISLAGITEMPLVMLLAQRVGPATGMPTWTEQGDLLFSVFAGQGEFPKIVLAPGDVEEMFELSMKAFNLAEIYQTPVIVLSDKFLSESYENIDVSLIKEIKDRVGIDRGKTSETFTKGYLRYKDSQDGISERVIPQKNGVFYQANSYEHLEDCHTTEDPKERIKQVNKRARKIKTYLKKHFSSPKFYGDKDSDIVFVSWGSTKHSILNAMKLLKSSNKKAGFIHFTHMYPLSTNLGSLFMDKNKRYVLVENNSTSQLGKLLRMELGVNIESKLLKYDGRPFLPEEIRDFALKI